MAQQNDSQPPMVGITEDDAVYFELYQRKIGPSEKWKADPPAKGCEVFIAKIPKDCFEKELIPILRQIGDIYMFRLMMETEETHRGFGFCVYTSVENAKEAVVKLNNFQIRKNYFLGVCFSVDNCRLFVGGIPKLKVKSEIFEEVRKVTENVVDIIVYPSAADKNKNRGFAFVEYTDHKSAAAARKKMVGNGIKLWGQNVAVDWAEPERKVDEETMSKVKILYVRNLMLTTSEETIYHSFSKFVYNEGEIVRVKKISDFAFVHFKTRDQAEIVKNKLNGAELEGSVIEVHFAKPPNNLDKHQKLLKKRSPSFENIIPMAEELKTLSFKNDINELNNLKGFDSPNVGTSYRNVNGRLSSKSKQYHTDIRQSSDGHFSNFALSLIQICQTQGWHSPFFNVQVIPILFPNSDIVTQGFVAQVYIPGLQCTFSSKNYAFTQEDAIQNASGSAIEWIYYNEVQMPLILSQKDAYDNIKDDFQIVANEIPTTMESPVVPINRIGCSPQIIPPQYYHHNSFTPYYTNNLAQPGIPYSCLEGNDYREPDSNVE